MANAIPRGGKETNKEQWEQALRTGGGKFICLPSSHEKRNYRSNFIQTTVKQNFHATEVDPQVPNLLLCNLDPSHAL